MPTHRLQTTGTILTRLLCQHPRHEFVTAEEKHLCHCPHHRPAPSVPWRGVGVRWKDLHPRQCQRLGQDRDERVRDCSSTTGQIRQQWQSNVRQKGSTPIMHQTIMITTMVTAMTATIVWQNESLRIPRRPPPSPSTPGKPGASQYLPRRCPLLQVSSGSQRQGCWKRCGILASFTSCHCWGSSSIASFRSKCTAQELWPNSSLSHLQDCSPFYSLFI